MGAQTIIKSALKATTTSLPSLLLRHRLGLGNILEVREADVPSPARRIRTAPQEDSCPAAHATRSEGLAATTLASTHPKMCLSLRMKSLRRAKFCSVSR